MSISKKLACNLIVLPEVPKSGLGGGLKAYPWMGGGGGAGGASTADSKENARYPRAASPEGLLPACLLPISLDPRPSQVPAGTAILSCSTAPAPLEIHAPTSTWAHLITEPPQVPSPGFPPVHSTSTLHHSLLVPPGPLLARPDPSSTGSSQPSSTSSTGSEFKPLTQTPTSCPQARTSVDEAASTPPPRPFPHVRYGQLLNRAHHFTCLSLESILFWPHLSASAQVPTSSQWGAPYPFPHTLISPRPNTLLVPSHAAPTFSTHGLHDLASALPSAALRPTPNTPKKSSHTSEPCQRRSAQETCRIHLALSLTSPAHSASISGTNPPH